MTASEHLSPMQFESFSDARGGAISAMHQGREIGSIDWNTDQDVSRIGSVDVHRDYRRQGIATDLYHRAGEAAGRPLVHSHERTDAGNAWAHSVGGEIPERTAVVIRDAEAGE